MPGRDGTGPQGFGPGTGWSEGYCQENHIKRNVNITPKHRNWLGSGYTKPLYKQRAFLNEKTYLLQKAEFLREQLRLLITRLSNGSGSEDDQ